MRGGYIRLGQTRDSNSKIKCVPPLATPESLAEEVQQILAKLQKSPLQSNPNKNDMKYLAHWYAAAMQAGHTHPYYRQILSFEEKLRERSFLFGQTFRNKEDMYEWQRISLFYRIIAAIAKSKYCSYDEETLSTAAEIMEDFKEVEGRNFWSAAVQLAKYDQVDTQTFLQLVTAVKDDSELAKLAQKMSQCYLTLAPLRQEQQFFWKTEHVVQCEVYRREEIAQMSFPVAILYGFKDRISAVCRSFNQSVRQRHAKKQQ